MKYANECISSQLDLFCLPSLDTSLEEGSWIYLEQQIKDAQNEIIFNIDQSEYLDLTSCMLYVSVKIHKKLESNSTTLTVDTPLEESAAIAPVNNFLHSLWKKVHVKIDTIDVEDTTSLYAYKEYILKILNTGHEEQGSLLSASCFYKDDGGQFENYEILTEEKKEIGPDNAKFAIKVPKTCNNGFINRRNLMMKGNGKFEMMGHLNLDIFGTNRLLLPKTPMQIKLFKNEDSFCLLGNDKLNYNIRIKDIKLRLRTVRVSDQVQAAHLATLVRNPANYHVKKTEVKEFKCNTSGKKISQEICKGRVPNIIIFGLSNYAYKEKMNPFNFQNFNVRKVELNVGKLFLPYTYALDIDYKTAHYLNGYISLFDTFTKPDIGNTVSREDYPNGYALYGFNLQPSINCSGDLVFLPKDEAVTVKIEFDGEPDDKFLDLICYLEYDKIIQIGSDRKVIP